MNRDECEFFRRMIIRYNSLQEGKERENLRNEIYSAMRPMMIKWISAILAKKGIFLSKEEILSRSWDCFLFCLRLFKPEKREIAVPNHFYSYTNFYIKTYNATFFDTTNNSQEELLANSSFSDDVNYDATYQNLEELDSFRKVLDKDHKLVFDDALMSLMPSNKEKQCRIKESALTSIRYQESKKIFKLIIDFLIRR